MRPEQPYEVPKELLKPGAKLMPLKGTWYMVDVVNNLVYSPKLKSRPMKVRNFRGKELVDVRYGGKETSSIYKVLWAAKHGVCLEDVPSGYWFTKDYKVLTGEGKRADVEKRVARDRYGEPIVKTYEQFREYLGYCIEAMQDKGEWKLYAFLKQYNKTMIPYVIRKLYHRKDVADAVVDEAIARTMAQITEQRKVVANPITEIRNQIIQICHRLNKTRCYDKPKVEKYTYHHMAEE